MWIIWIASNKQKKKKKNQKSKIKNHKSTRKRNPQKEKEPDAQTPKKTKIQNPKYYLTKNKGPLQLRIFPKKMHDILGHLFWTSKGHFLFFSSSFFWRPTSPFVTSLPHFSSFFFFVFKLNHIQNGKRFRQAFQRKEGDEDPYGRARCRR